MRFKNVHTVKFLVLVRLDLIIAQLRHTNHLNLWKKKTVQGKNDN